MKLTGIVLFMSLLAIVEPIKYDVYDLRPQSQSITQADRDLMARIVMSESSTLPYEGKLAVASTIVNRLESSKYPNTVVGVSTAYSVADNGGPTDECYQVVDEVLESNPFPSDMYSFRTGKYHKFGYEYMRIDNTYFVTETDYNKLVNEEN